MSVTPRITPATAPEAQATWETLWAQSAIRTPFATWAYVQAWQNYLRLRSEIIWLADEKGTVGGLFVWLRKRGPYTEMVLPPFTAYSPLLLRHLPAETELHAQQSALDVLLQTLRTRYDAVQIHLPPALGDARPLRWNGWTTTPLYTYTLPLASADALLQSWSANPRRTWQKHHAEFVISEASDQGATLAKLSAGSYARHNRPAPVAPEALVPILSTLQTAGCVRLFTATQHGQTVGGLAILHDDTTAYYWVAGSTPGPAMTVLLGHALPRLFADGLTSFDFMGANTPSIAEFKRRFGGVLTLYLRGHLTGKRGLRWYLSLRQAARQLRYG